MSYKVRAPEGNFEKMGTGLKQAVCTHFIPIGIQSTPWGSQEHLILVFEFNKRMTNGKPFVLCREYNATLGEGSKLREDLESWRGRPFTEEELKGFDMEKLVGANCMIDVVEKPRKDGKNPRESIGHIARKMTELPDIKSSGNPPPDWVQEKAAAGQSPAEAAAETASATESSDLPF